jgi:hypothetical protein
LRVRRRLVSYDVGCRPISILPVPVACPLSAAPTSLARKASPRASSGVPAVVAVSVRSLGSGEARQLTLGSEGFACPRGRWSKIEQEVVLNTPKQANCFAPIPRLR